LKAGFDFIFALVLVLLTLPVVALSALVILAVDRQNPFFTQARLGKNKRVFTILKLRTMKNNQVTGIGKVFRRTGLDELPQLINVLRGEMSIVGPRPCVGYEYDMYEAWQKRRFDSVPGLTGLWQVSGKNRTTFNEMINLDIEYSEQSRLALDLKIMLKTVPALVTQCYDQRVKRKQARRAALQATPVSESTGVVSTRVNLAG